MRSNTLSYETSNLFYRTLGKGRPLVLIHGFGEDGDIWKNQVDSLKDQFHLIIPDLPGSGKSELINDMSMEGMAEVIKEILILETSKAAPPAGRAGAAGAFLAGHSMGGYITLAFAEKYPGLLSALALVHSSAFADSKEKKAARLRSIAFIKKYGAFEFLKTAIPGLFTEQWSVKNRQCVEELVKKGDSFTDEAMIQYYRAMIKRPDRTAVLKKFAKPILFLIGAQDNAVPFQQSLQQCYLPRVSQVHILRNSAHMGMLEEPAKVNNALLQLNNGF